MTAVEQLITQDLGIWSSAVEYKSAAGRGGGNKINSYGVNRLRELILELAVNGFLVRQDPDDEPASELLKNISEEKNRLVEVGKLKKPKPLSPIAEEDRPPRLPDG